MGLFTKEKGGNENAGSGSKPRQRPAKSKGAVPKRHQSDMTGLTGFNAAAMSKGRSKGPERGKMKRSNSGLTMKSKDSTFTRANKTVAGTTSSSRRDKPKASLEMLMSMQAETDKISSRNHDKPSALIETEDSEHTSGSKASKKEKLKRRGSSGAIKDKVAGRRVSRTFSNDVDDSASLTGSTSTGTKAGQKITCRRVSRTFSNDDNDAASLTGSTASGIKAGQKISRSKRDGRSRSPPSGVRSKSRGRGDQRIDGESVGGGRKRRTSRSRSRGPTGRGLKSSQSENLGYMSKQRPGLKGSNSSDTFGGSERKTKGSSKLAQLKSSNHTNDSCDSVTQLKKENHDLYTKKRAVQRQLEDERDKTERLELKVKDLQRQLERGNKINNTAKSSDPTKDLEDKIASLESENSEWQFKLKKERREHEQIIYKKDQELEELNQSLEQFMEADRGSSGGGGGSSELKLRNELAQTKAQLRVTEQQHSSLKEEMKNQELELKTLKAKQRTATLDQEITQADQDSLALKKENEELNQKLRDKDETIAHLMDQLKDLKLSGGGGGGGGGAYALKGQGGDSNLNDSSSGLGLSLWNRMSPGALNNRKTVGTRADRMAERTNTPF